MSTPPDHSVFGTARVVSFLAGGDGGWAKGQTLRANGGVV
jgi:hypothetical protein